MVQTEIWRRKLGLRPFFPLSPRVFVLESKGFVSDGKPPPLLSGTFINIPVGVMLDGTTTCSWHTGACAACCFSHCAACVLTSEEAPTCRSALDGDVTCKACVCLSASARLQTSNKYSNIWENSHVDWHHNAVNQMFIPERLKKYFPKVD